MCLGEECSLSAGGPDECLSFSKELMVISSLHFNSPGLMLNGVYFNFRNFLQSTLP